MRSSRAAMHCLPMLTAELLRAGTFWSPFATFLSISVAYAVVAGSLVAFVEPLAAGSGIPEIKTYLNGIHIKGLLAVRMKHAAQSLHLQGQPLHITLLSHPRSHSLSHGCFCMPAVGTVHPRQLLLSTLTSCSPGKQAPEACRSGLWWQS